MTLSMSLFVLFLSLAVIFLCASVFFAYKAKFTAAHNKNKRFLLQEKHIALIKLFYLATGGAVLSIIKVVFENGSSWGSPQLLITHRIAIIILTLLLVIIFFRLNGRKNIFLHRKVVYVFFIALLIALITGSILFSQHPHFK